jgi:hypothetical protein
MTEETSEIGDEDYDECIEVNLPSFSLHFDITLRSFIMVWVIIMFTLMLNDTRYNDYATILVNAAVILVIGLTLIVLNEAIIGNKIQLPELTNKKDVSDLISRVVITSLAWWLGGVAITGSFNTFISLVRYSPTTEYFEIIVLVIIIVMAFGAGLIIAGLRYLTPLFVKEPEQGIE